MKENLKVVGVILITFAFAIGCYFGIETAYDYSDWGKWKSGKCTVAMCDRVPEQVPWFPIMCGVSDYDIDGLRAKYSTETFKEFRAAKKVATDFNR